MADLNPRREIEESLSRSESGYTEEQSRAEISGTSSSQMPFMNVNEDHVVYKVYKRRWFGLIQLVLLNIVVSWDVSTSNSKALYQRKKTHQLTLCPVAILLRCCRYGCHLLLHNRKYHKLVKHGVPLRLRCGCPSHLIHPPHRRSTTRNHRVLDLHPRRQLATLRRHTLFPTLLPPHHDWTNPDRVRPALCPLRSNPLLRSLVFAQRPCLGHRARLACQPLRRGPWPADQPFPSPPPGLDPEYDPLCCADLLRRYHSIILHPFETPHALIALHDASAPLDSTHPQTPPVQLDLLPSLPPFCHLRWSLQFGLVSSYPVLLALRFLRQRIRHRRRAADPHRPGCGRH